MEHVPGISDKLREGLKNGITIAYRLKNDSLDYSIMNRPEPNISGIDGPTLAVAMVHAAKTFKLVTESVAGKRSETVQRDDGRRVSYNEFIEIDWMNGEVRSSRRRETTVTVLEGVIGQLMNEKKPGFKVVPGGAN